MLLVLSCVDPPDTSPRAQFGFVVHTLRNTVLIFTCLCSQKQPNQAVVRNTPTDPSEQCGNELMWGNLDFVVALTVHQQVSKSSIRVIPLVNKPSVHFSPQFTSSWNPICTHTVIESVSIQSASQQVSQILFPTWLLVCNHSPFPTFYLSVKSQSVKFFVLQFSAPV